MIERDEIGGLLSRWKCGFRRLRYTNDWPEFAGDDWLNRIMSIETNDRTHRKQGRSIERWTLTATDGRKLIVYLKRHYILPRKHGLLAVLFPRRSYSPGMQEFEHLQWAESQGLPVPRAVAAGELVGPRGQLQGFIAIEELAGMLPLHEAIPLVEQSLDAATFQKWKRSLSDELVRLSIEFHGRRVFHKDWYLCHFYIDEADTRRLPDAWTGRVHVIDLHRMTHHRFLRSLRKAKDLAQLLYSTEPVSGITDEDRKGFWRKYREWTSLPWLVAWIARIKWRAYQRHDAPKG